MPCPLRKSLNNRWGKKSFYFFKSNKKSTNILRRKKRKSPSPQRESDFQFLTFPTKEVTPDPSRIQGEYDHLGTLFWVLPALRTPLIVHCFPSLIYFFAWDLAKDIWDFIPTEDGKSLSNTRPPSKIPASTTESFFYLN